MGDEKELNSGEQLNFFEEEPAGDTDAEPQEGEQEPTAGDDECACDEQEEEQTGKGKKGKKDKPGSKAPAPAAAPAPTAYGGPKKYTAPFFVRYWGEMLWLTGLNDGVSYTEAQIKELLISNGYTEFRDVTPVFNLNAETNTLIITIQGSRKGGGHRGG